MSTYSINTGTPFESTFLGNLSPDLILNKIPNNTSQLIVPESVRDALYTIWDNITFKKVSSTTATYSFIGLSGKNSIEPYANGNLGLKMLIGKPELNNINILDNDLLEYTNTSDTDLFIYNFKADTSVPQNQFTKVSFLAGSSHSLFKTAPYILSQQTATSSEIDLSILNENGKIVIDAPELHIGSPNTKIILEYGTGSTGIKTLPGGITGDLQTNLENCDFGFVNGSTASIGNVLLMGASNSPYWGTLDVNSIFTLNQVLGSGNVTDGYDITMTDEDTINIGGIGSTYGYIKHDSNGPVHYTQFGSNGGKVMINAIDEFVLNVKSNVATNDKAILTRIAGKAEWGKSTAEPGGSPTNIQFYKGPTSSPSFDGDGALAWANIAKSLQVNNPNPSRNSSISLKNNANGGIFIDADSKGRPSIFIENSNNAIFQIAGTGTTGLGTFTTNINNDYVPGSNYALAVRANDNGAIHINAENVENIIKVVNNINSDTPILNFKLINNAGTLQINNSSPTYSLSVKSNDMGGIYVDSNGKPNSPLLIEDKSSGNIHFKIDDSSAGSENKFTFVNSPIKKNITLSPDSGNGEFRIDYKDNSSTIAMSPKNNDGMYIGVTNAKNKALYLGSHTSNLNTYDASVVIYPNVSQNYLSMGNSRKSVVIGNSNKSTHAPGVFLSGNDKRNLGINIVPQVDFHLNGILATAPQELVYNNTTVLNGIKSSYLLLNESFDSGTTIQRVGDYSPGNQVTSYGTTLKLWNRSGADILVDHTFTHTSGEANIYFPIYGLANTTSVYTWSDGYMLELVYLMIPNYMLSSPGFDGDLINEGGIWYKVN